MITVQEFSSIALSFPEAVEAPHFEKKSFRIRKKIFATLDVPNNKAVLKLTILQQSVFCNPERSIIYPVPGKWGKKGWTMIELKKVRKTMCRDAVAESYFNIAPKKAKSE